MEIGRCHSRTPFRHSSQNPSPFPSIDGCHSHTPFRSFPQNPPPFPAIVPCLSRPFLCRARIVLSAIPVLSACFIGTGISGQPLSFCTYRHDYFEILSKKPVGYDKNAVSLLGKEGRKTKIDVLSAASFSFRLFFQRRKDGLVSVIYESSSDFFQGHESTDVIFLLDVSVRNQFVTGSINWICRVPSLFRADFVHLKALIFSNDNKRNHSKHPYAPFCSLLRPQPPSVRGGDLPNCRMWKVCRQRYGLPAYQDAGGDESGNP